jgi:hypothetical protein
MKYIRAFGQVNCSHKNSPYKIDLNYNLIEEYHAFIQNVKPFLQVKRCTSKCRFQTAGAAQA